MNKITMTAGVVALSAASLHAADAMVSNMTPGSQQATKPWSISATLRGFYDDNYATAPKDVAKGSFGLEVSPSASLNLIRDQTAFGLSYVYSYRYYENRDHLDLPPDDQSHQVNAKLSHAFTPRFKLDITDSFAVGQEPELLGNVNGTPNATFLRSNGDNLRNFADASFSAGITDNLTAVLGYANEYYDYDEEGPNSRSAFLDRTENRGSINLRQVVLPKTVAIVGYQFEKIDYNAPFNPATGGGSPIIIPTGGGGGFAYRSDERNSYAHYFFVGVDQGFSPTLNGSLRAGAQYTKFDNLSTLKILDPGIQDEQWSPYVDANLTWFYMKDSYAQIGVRHQRAQTDVAYVANNPNLDAESTSVYGSISHRFWGAFVASLIGQYQHSSYSDSGSDSSEDYFMAGLNLTYEINKFLSTEIGYNYDRLSSDVSSVPNSGLNRGYTRNRVYIGIRGTY